MGEDVEVQKVPNIKRKGIKKEVLIRKVKGNY